MEWSWERAQRMIVEIRIWRLACWVTGIEKKEGDREGVFWWEEWIAVCLM